MQDTKIAKVVRIGCQYAFGNHDLYNIQLRCLNMIKTWKSALLDWRGNKPFIMAPSETPAAKLVTRHDIPTTEASAMEEHPTSTHNTTQLETSHIQQFQDNGDGDRKSSGTTKVEQTGQALSNNEMSTSKTLPPPIHKERMQPKPMRLLIPPNDHDGGSDGSDIYHRVGNTTKTTQATFPNHALDKPADSTAPSLAAMADNQTPLPRLFSTTRSS
jgi:hypothetical protein